MQFLVLLAFANRNAIGLLTTTAPREHSVGLPEFLTSILNFGSEGFFLCWAGSKTFRGDKYTQGIKSKVVRLDVTHIIKRIFLTLFIFFSVTHLPIEHSR